ncbi:aminotransferase class III-fold pyridoxal phosphate-dependent enzyme [Chengkuizengella sediminis]|uniref:aminotransferase class III-fold pyridoxal phosphate-dependent enzyme n=1 Tax=Chengkuizengella sediminis TaxID=1885917 RepID=UPI00138982E5|nr:aminotransferase class III-fold pyridoxal phosphate-dependent enzyme [Chengkuizengella sediminis]NDI34976.1 aminotransferase class III-fold pyridoxal phosphate-dependent enzyme [Chengkuizengella sediminis]
MKPYTYENNQQHFKRALKFIPTGIYGHLGPTEGCYIPISAYPFFCDKAKGSYFWDVDGNRFIDYMCAYGPNVLGYNDEDVDAAAMKQLELGNCVSTPSTIMIDFAELLVDTVEMADWAFFAKNGTDVTGFALMVAKAATGRKKTILVKGGYHGVAPWTQKLGYAGIVEEDVTNNLYVDFNNYEQVENLVKEHPDEIACFMATPYHHPVFEDSQLPEKDYWNKIRKLCTDHGIVLAIDDVRCGFRLDHKGSDHYFGFKADLMCFCKALGNGYNFSALCGIDALRDAAASIMYTGSYWMSAMPFAAGITCINKLQKLNGAKLMQNIGEKLTTGLVDIAKDNGFNLKISGISSMWYMRITNDDSLMLHQEWISECVRRGVFFTGHHNLFINCSLTDEDINLTHEIADASFKVLKTNHPELF